MWPLGGPQGPSHPDGPTSKKNVCSGCGRSFTTFYDRRTYRTRDLDAGGLRIYLDFDYRRVACPDCGVKQENLDWLADNPRFTRGFAQAVGRDCRTMSLKDAAARHRLSWGAVRRLEVSYMEALLAKHPPPKRLRAIGMDEVSIRKGHTYAITVADLDRRRPIWMSESPGRKEEDLDKFFVDLGPKRAAQIKLAVMDMWKPFRASTSRHAPQARILFDKFHILGHLADALDKVRRREYWRVNKKDRRFIKGQRYTLLSNKANLDTDGRRSLKTLLKANRRLHKAYLLKEAFGQLWDYQYPASARKFFDNWKAQLKWQRLESFEQFAAMVERHWDGIVAYCHPDNKVSLGFMEGLNNKIRSIQRRAFGIKDQRYLKLKVLTSFIQDP
jgi:transposase